MLTKTECIQILILLGISLLACIYRNESLMYLLLLVTDIILIFQIKTNFDQNTILRMFLVFTGFNILLVIFTYQDLQTDTIYSRFLVGVIINMSISSVICAVALVKSILRKQKCTNERK